MRIPTPKSGTGGTSRDELDQRLRATVDAVPTGRVATYGQVAEEAGLPGRARRVGWLLRNLPPGSSLPWHRIIGAGGKLSLPPDSSSGREQRKRLRAEGVELNARGRVDMRRFAWRPRG
jgi:methylated-DNA-protein-cysteine methyltransferase related protein